MVLDRTLGRNIEELLRHEQRDEGHHLQVRLERLELRPLFRFAVGSGLIDRKLRRERRLLERIGFCPLLLRRHIDGDDVLAALAQHLQYRLAERLLAVHHDTHSTVLLAVIPTQRSKSRNPWPRSAMGPRLRGDDSVARSKPPRRARLSRAP